MTETQLNLVEHPPHYLTDAGIEAIDVMEQYGLGLHLGNAMKYLLRAGRKDDLATDLRKAGWYVQRWLDGIWERNGVEFTSASDDVDGGLAWRTPEQIADAFGLVGARRTAVVEILEAAAFESHSRDEIRRVGNALEAIRKAVSEAEQA
jgi:hypothetical protein